MPADCKLGEGMALEVDESALTGESLPVTIEPGKVSSALAFDMHLL